MGLNDWRTWAIVAAAAVVGWKAYSAARDTVEDATSDARNVGHPWG